MEEQTTRIIEINGVKMEVDLRQAKKIDVFKVGDPVKVLRIRGDSYNSTQIYPGVIVGFAEFSKSPAIEIMVLKEDYNGVTFDFITITQEDKEDFEIIHYNNCERLFTQSSVIGKFDKQIEKKKIELMELERKKKYYIEDFQKAFETIMVKDD